MEFEFDISPDVSLISSVDTSFDSLVLFVEFSLAVADATLGGIVGPEASSTGTEFAFGFSLSTGRVTSWADVFVEISSLCNVVISSASSAEDGSVVTFATDAAGVTLVFNSRFCSGVAPELKPSFEEAGFAISLDIF